MKHLLTILPLALALAFVGCSDKKGDGESKPAATSKDEAPAKSPTADKSEAPSKPAPSDCPDPDDKDNVFYTSTDTAFCATAKIRCGENQTAFNDKCGCGCVNK